MKISSAGLLIVAISTVLGAPTPTPTHTPAAGILDQGSASNDGRMDTTTPASSIPSNDDGGQFRLTTADGQQHSYRTYEEFWAAMSSQVEDSSDSEQSDEDEMLATSTTGNHSAPTKSAFVAIFPSQEAEGQNVGTGLEKFSETTTSDYPTIEENDASDAGSEDEMDNSADSMAGVDSDSEMSSDSEEDLFLDSEEEEASGTGLSPEIMDYKMFVYRETAKIYTELHEINATNSPLAIAQKGSRDFEAAIETKDLVKAQNIFRDAMIAHSKITIPQSDRQQITQDITSWMGTSLYGGPPAEQMRAKLQLYQDVALAYSSLHEDASPQSIFAKARQAAFEYGKAKDAGKMNKATKIFKEAMEAYSKIEIPEEKRQSIVKYIEEWMKVKL